MRELDDRVAARTLDVPDARGPSSSVATGRRWWLVAAIVALLVVLFAVPPPEPTHFWDALFDAGHLPLFGALALLLRRLLPGRDEPGVSIRAFGLAVLLGVATELVQTLQPLREPSAADVLNDGAGAAAFLLIRGAWAAPQRPDRRRWSIAVALLLIAAAATPPVLTIAAYGARSRALPVLFALDGSWRERDTVVAEGARLTPAALPPGDGRAQAFARLDLLPGAYSTLVLEEPAGDWTHYRQVVFDLVSDLDAPITLNVRIHDAGHINRLDDRYNGQIVVRPGPTHVAIAVDEIRDAPASRAMRMDRVRGILLFAAGLSRPTHVFVGPVRLE